ncbi:MAG: hypothetical protein WA956_05730 [Stenotrophomonas sp.]
MVATITNLPLCHGLALARLAAQKLAGQGITVYAAKVRGPLLPVLYVNTLPAGIDYGLRCRYPDGHGGTVLIHSALYEGCRLEWTVVRPARDGKAREVAYG